jgi:ribosomal protein S12 methylthiotransferase accessory factor
MTALAGSDVVDPYTGLVTGLAELPTSRAEPAVFAVGARVADPCAYGLDGDPPLRGSGAGLTASEAASAAVGEACERYACSCAPEGELVVATATELRARSRTLVDPQSWALYAPEQYPGLPYAQFDDDTRVTWATGVDVLTGRECLVPASLVWFGPRATIAPSGTAQIAPGISTGAACGSTFESAAVRALLELIERDAFMITWRARLAPPRIVLAQGSRLETVFERVFARPHLRYRLFDVTADLPGAVCFGLLEDLRATPGAVVAGGAAGPTRSHAVYKTLIELAQGHLWAMDSEARQGRFVSEEDFTNVRSFEDRMRLYSTTDMREALAPLDGSLQVSVVGDEESGPGTLRNLAVGIEMAGPELGPVMAADITPVDLRDCGVRVVRALVPGLERMEADHRHPFLAGSRWRSARERLDPTLPPVPAFYPHPYP